MEKQFNVKLLSKKTGTRKFSSFRKSQNHLKNLGLFSPESPIFLWDHWSRVSPRISRATSKIEDLPHTCKELSVKTKWANEENQIFLDKNGPMGAPRS